MRLVHRAALVVLGATTAFAAPNYKDGWTPKGVELAITSCTEELVDGAWRNTKKEAGVDPKAPLTPEIRQEIQPQIDAFNKLCACVVKHSAEKFGKADYEKNSREIDDYAVQLIDKGTCKTPTPPQPPR